MSDFSRIGLRHRKAQNNLELPAKLLFKPFDAANFGQRHRSNEMPTSRREALRRFRGDSFHCN